MIELYGTPRYLLDLGFAPERILFAGDSAGGGPVLPYDQAIAFDWRKVLHPDDLPRILQESIAGEALRLASGSTATLAPIMPIFKLGSVV